MKIPRWLKSTGKWILILLVVLISVYALAYAWISWSAKREWVQTKKELEARGEKLSFVDFVPPEVPDEENFFMTPLFRELQVPHPQGGYRLDNLFIKTADGKYKVYALSNARKYDSVVNLEVFADSLRTPENKNQSAANVLLSAFEQKQGLWEEVYKAAEKPYARFPFQYENTIEQSSVHLAELIPICRELSIRSWAYMEAGHSENAERDIMLIFRLSDTISTEPNLISYLVRSQCFQIGIVNIWEGVQRHAWKPSQLEHFENFLEGMNFSSGLNLALRGHRAAMNSAFTQVLEKPVRARSLITQLRDPFPASLSGEQFSWWVAYLPWKALYWSMALESSSIQRLLDALKKAEGKEINQKNIPDFLPPRGIKLWKYAFAVIGLQNIEGVITRYANTMAYVDMARIACALERYRIALGAYPEKLDQLLPIYIGKLPNDVASGKPYHYRLDAPDKFTLWSVGFDGVDDNATPNKNRSKGDWVWVFGEQK